MKLAWCAIALAFASADAKEKETWPLALRDPHSESASTIAKSCVSLLWANKPSLWEPFCRQPGQSNPGRPCSSTFQMVYRSIVRPWSLAD